jgi:hypothetical protein
MNSRRWAEVAATSARFRSAAGWAVWAVPATTQTANFVGGQRIFRKLLHQQIRQNRANPVLAPAKHALNIHSADENLLNLPSPPSNKIDSLFLV